MIYKCDGFKAGDIVRIRSWESMSEEFDTGSSYGTIYFPVRDITFNMSMRCLCGLGFHILGFKEDRYNTVIFEESDSNEYSIENRYIITPDMIELTSCKTVLAPKKRAHRKFRCANCGNILNKSNVTKTAIGTYICNNCRSIKGYSTQNNVTVHQPTKSRKTYGFELECIPKNEAHKNAVINSTYRLIPTHDSSLPPRGVEFKTPTYNGLVGVRSLFKTFNKHLNFSNNKCGQHINIGDTSYISTKTIRAINNYAPNIFDSLYKYMFMHQKDTERVCGRFFNRFAARCSYGEHCSWINLQHNNRIEFRLSKFVSPDQYFELTNMWTEMIDCIIKNFIKGDRLNILEVRHEELYYRAEITQKKLVKIFKKYADNKAVCQNRLNKTVV